MLYYIKYIFVLFVLVAVLGCAHTTAVNVADIDWHGRLGKMATAQDVERFNKIGSWWTLIDSQELEDLIAQALTYNENIQAKKENFLASISSYTQAESFLFPVVNATYEGGRQRACADKMIVIGKCNSRHIGTSHALNVELTYQVDLFGENIAKAKVAELGVLVNLETWKAQMVQVATEVTNTWLSMQLLLHQEKILQKQIKNLINIEKLTTIAYNAGNVDMQRLLDVKNQVVDLKQALLTLESQKETVDIQLRVLVGKPELTIKYGFYRFQSLPVIAGIPASMIKEEPNIRIALAGIRIADQNVASAIAARFPTLSLSASVGRGTTELKGLLRPENLVWQLGGNLAAPIFDYGNRKAEVQKQKHMLQQSIHLYKNALFQAFSRVKINLSDIYLTNKKLHILKEKEKNIQLQLKLKKLEYRNGSAGATDLLLEQNEEYATQKQIEEQQQIRLVKQITFYSLLANRWLQNYAEKTVTDWKAMELKEVDKSFDPTFNGRMANLYIRSQWKLENYTIKKEDK